MQVNKLLNGLLKRGCDKNNVFDMFKEVEFKLMQTNKRRKNNKSMTCESSLEEALH